jgi:methylmalonyl-CoA mutase C-terminal domain/subunit
MARKIRVLVGKPGLDGHDRGAKVVAAALRDAGMEVIYTGLHQSPEQIVDAALQEDVDVVALSILSGAHMTLFPEVLTLMKRRGLGDRLLTGGGIIPPEDMDTLARKGVGRLFGPGTSTQDIAAYIREWFAAEHQGDDAALVAPPAKLRGAVRRPVSEPTPKPSSRKNSRPAAKAKPAAGDRKPKRKGQAVARAGTRSARRTAGKRTGRR